MSNRSHGLSDTLHRYLLENTVREADILTRLREETMAMPMARMQIAPEQGQFMQMILKLLGAKNTLEVGVFTGYSTLATALALPGEGRIVACDLEKKYTDVAQRYWREAGVDKQIDLRLAPAAETLAGLIDAGEAGRYDFAFIDADKENYQRYYEQCLTLIRAGGIIAIDNAFWHGKVAEAGQDEETRAIDAVNRLVGADERVDCGLVPIGDGLLLARKR